MKKRLVPFVLTMVLAVSGLGCVAESELTPADSAAIRDTIEGFWDAYNTQDYDECLIHVEDTYNVGASGVKDLLKAKWEEIGEVTVVSVEDPKVSRSEVTVDVTMTYGGQSEPEIWEHPMTKKGESWRIIFD